jgi:arginase
MIVGLGELTMPRAVGLEPLAPGRVLLSDGRDLDPGEADLLSGSEVQVVPRFTDLLAAPLPDGPLYVHFDSDVIDARETPAHNYPVPGGPSAQEVGQVFARLSGTGRVVAASMSAWNPDLDQDGRTGELCMSSFKVLLS